MTATLVLTPEGEPCFLQRHAKPSTTRRRPADAAADSCACTRERSPASRSVRPGSTARGLQMLEGPSAPDGHADGPRTDRVRGLENAQSIVGAEHPVDRLHRAVCRLDHGPRLRGAIPRFLDHGAPRIMPPLPCGQVTSRARSRGSTLGRRSREDGLLLSRERSCWHVERVPNGVPTRIGWDGPRGRLDATGTAPSTRLRDDRSQKPSGRSDPRHPASRRASGPDVVPFAAAPSRATGLLARVWCAAGQRASPRRLGGLLSRLLLAAMLALLDFRGSDAARARRV